MAITISGENNNDRILASDGVIDQLSGINIAGIVTATSFTGDLTGNVTGNLTGNVNSTSPLLLQTGGSERFRITGNNELGIAGANYGSAGQVLTSGGSGSAVTWSAIPSQVNIANNADNRVITGGSGTNLNGEAALTFDGQTLTISAPTNDTPLIVDTGSSNGSHLRFQKDGANKHFIGSGGGIGLGDIDDLALRTVDNIIFGVGTSEKVRITSSGNVGINDTDPSYALNVIGDNTASNGIGMLKGIIGVQNNTTAYGSYPTAGISFQTKYRTGPDVPLDVAAIYGGKENTTNGDKDGYMGFAVREEPGSGTQERMRITSEGHVLFSGLTTKNDPRNVNGITLKSTAGVSFQNFGANGSRNWRIRPDDQSRWGDLDFSVSPTANDAK